VGRQLFRGIVAHGDGKKRETDNQPNGLPNPPHRQKTLCRQHCTMLCQQTLRLVDKCLFDDADKNESAWGVLLVKCCRYQKVVGEQMCNDQGVMQLKERGALLIDRINIKQIILFYLLVDTKKQYTIISENMIPACPPLRKLK
jgi:hypothetical protein